MPQVKSQAAMEYLMTYGWSILIISIVLGALYVMGVFGGASPSPSTACLATTSYLCQNPALSTNGLLTVQIGKIDSAITITGLSCSNTTALPPFFYPVSIPLSPGATTSANFFCSLPASTIGTAFSGTLWIQYTSGASTGLTTEIGMVNAKATGVGLFSLACSQTIISSALYTSSLSTTVGYTMYGGGGGGGGNSGVAGSSATGSFAVVAGQTVDIIAGGGGGAGDGGGGGGGSGYYGGGGGGGYDSGGGGGSSAILVNGALQVYAAGGAGSSHGGFSFGGGGGTTSGGAMGSSTYGNGQAGGSLFGGAGGVDTPDMGGGGGSGASGGAGGIDYGGGGGGGYGGGGGGAGEASGTGGNGGSSGAPGSASSGARSAGGAGGGIGAAGSSNYGGGGGGSVTLTWTGSCTALP